MLVGCAESVCLEMQRRETGWGDTGACPDPLRLPRNPAPCPRWRGNPLPASHGSESHPGELHLKGEEPSWRPAEGSFGSCRALERPSETLVLEMHWSLDRSGLNGFAAAASEHDVSFPCFSRVRQDLGQHIILPQPTAGSPPGGTYLLPLPSHPDEG